MDHALKCAPAFFAAVRDGRKPFEVRRHDRDFQVGDTVTLREHTYAEMIVPDGTVDHTVGFPCGTYTGRVERREITYVLTHAQFPGGVPEGWCVLGFGKEGA
jgi:hypothetical protein